MVVDASVWVSALVSEEVQHSASRSWLGARLRDGLDLIVPTLLLAELAGTITRHTGLEELGRRSVERIFRAPGLRIVSLDLDLGREAARLATRLRLRGADAVYVATAHSLQVPLVTWDQELAERAREVVEIVRPA